MSLRPLIGMCVLGLMMARPATAGTIEPVALNGTRYVPAPVGVPMSTVVTIFNLGTSDLNVSSMGLVGDPRFTLTAPTQPFTIAASQTVDVSVSFTATEVSGLLTADLVISSDDPARPVVTVSFEGCAGPPAVGLTPAAHDFGVIAVMSTLVPFQVTNVGCAALEVTTLVATGPLYLHQGAGGVLWAGESQPFWVALVPAGATGPLTGTVTAVTSAPGPSPVVALSGTGIHGYLTPSFLSLDFFSQVGKPAAQRPVSLRNSTGYAVDVTRVEFSDPAYSLPDGAIPPFSVAPGAEALVAITCTPSHLGPHDGTVTFVTSGQATVIDVTCTGSPPLYLGYVDHAFGPVPVPVSATHPFSLGNNGLQPITITSIAITGPAAADFTLEPMFAQPQVLAAGVTLFSPAGLQFRPSENGPRTATLAITSDDLSTPLVEIPLSGEGFTPALSLDRDRIDVGNVVIGVPWTETLSLTNLGTTELVVAIETTGAWGPGGAGQSLSIPVGATFPLALTITPQALGPLDGTLVLHVTDPPLVVPLTATGIAAGLVFDEVAPVVDLGRWPIGATSPPVAVTLRNVSRQSLTFRRLGTTNLAFVVTPPSRARLEPGEAVTFEVVFEPTVVGPQRGEIWVLTDGVERPAAVQVLAAEGLPAEGASGCTATEPPTAAWPLGLGLVLLRRRRRAHSARTVTSCAPSS